MNGTSINEAKLSDHANSTVLWVYSWYTDFIDIAAVVHARYLSMYVAFYYYM